MEQEADWQGRGGCLLRGAQVGSVGDGHSVSGEEAVAWMGAGLLCEPSTPPCFPSGASERLLCKQEQ